MNIELTRGGTFALSREVPNIKNLGIVVSWTVRDPSLVLDPSVFLLNDRNRITSPRDIVFYNNPVSGDGALQRLAGDGGAQPASYSLEIPRLRDEILEVLFVLSVRESTLPGLTLGTATGFTIQLTRGSTGPHLCRYQVSEPLGPAGSVELGRLYRRNNEWRFQAVGQVANERLGGVVGRYGGAPAQSPPQVPPAQTRSQPVREIGFPPSPIQPAPVAPFPTPARPVQALPPQPAPASQPASLGTACGRCGGQIGVLDRLTFNDDGRCRGCRGEVKRILGDFRAAFLSITARMDATPGHFEGLFRGLDASRIRREEALTLVQADSVGLLERMVSFAASNMEISVSEYEAVHAMGLTLGVPPALAKPVYERLEYLRYLTKVRNGDLPTVRTHVHLESDEICHFSAQSVFRKLNRVRPHDISGLLTATNKRLHFSSHGGGWTVGFKNVMHVTPMPGAVFLELSVMKGGGAYYLADPWLAEAVLTALTRMHKRQLLAPGERASRYIPQNVKVSVWQRDQGRCRECGSGQHLEFDHVIPISRGGATSANNLQLLCRTCNLAKRDNI